MNATKKVDQSVHRRDQNEQNQIFKLRPSNTRNKTTKALQCQRIYQLRQINSFAFTIFTTWTALYCLQRGLLNENILKVNSKSKTGEHKTNEEQI